jgi:hypothetical protein
MERGLIIFLLLHAVALSYILLLVKKETLILLKRKGNPRKHYHGTGVPCKGGSITTEKILLRKETTILL